MADKEQPIQIFFTRKMSLAMIVEKCNQWNRKGKYRYKMIEFLRYDDLKCAASVRMVRDGYRITLDDYTLLS